MFSPMNFSVFRWMKALSFPRGGSLLLALVSLAMAGCETTGTGTTGSGAGTGAAPVQSAAPVQAQSLPDVIQIGDQVVVSITDVPNTPPPFQQQVRTDGKITLLQSYEFVAAGKLRQALEKEIEHFYVTEKEIYKRMTVSVAIPPRFVNVGGEVRGQGQLVHPGQLTVVKAIHAAGGFTDYANRRKIQITRASDKSKITVDYKKAVSDPSADVPVYPGDIIFVPKGIF